MRYFILSLLCEFLFCCHPDKEFKRLITLLGSSGFTCFSANIFTPEADTFAFVWLWLAQGTDLCCYLSQSCLSCDSSSMVGFLPRSVMVLSFNFLAVQRKYYANSPGPAPGFDPDATPCNQHQQVPEYFKTFRNSFHHVIDQCTVQPMKAL
jgi:hypothetical protein